jgi:DNA mismatch endonuclease (patch repair protein)
LHRAGWRFRVDVPLPSDRRRRADIVFSRVGLYVFIDGCFWHGCPDHFVTPKTRTDFWLNKVTGNHARDVDTDRRLADLGLTSLRIWEHVPPELAAERIGAVYLALSGL